MITLIGDMKMRKNNKHTETESICLNNQTVGNLKKYLTRFPNSAKVVIAGVGKNYIDYDCQIACNFEHQEKTNTVMFTLGLPI